MNKILLSAAATVLAASGLLAPGGTTAQAAAGVPRCEAGDLAASYHARDAGVGHRYGVIRLTNVSGHACSTGGYGGLSYVGGGNGTQVGAAAVRDPGTVRTIVLRPGDRVASKVDEVVAGNYPRRTCRPTPVDGFRVYVPDETRSLFVEHPTTGCARRAVHLVSHQPYRRA